jgi:hypothetical protein
MRTKLLIAFALIFLAGFTFAQNLVLSHDGETLEPNAEITVEGSAMDPEIVVELAVTNNGSASIDVLCQRYEIDMVSGSMSAICWGGLCYPPNTSLSPLATTIEPGVTVDNDFSGHYYPQGNEGVSTIAYTFFDEANPNDSVMVTVLYDGLMVGIGESNAAGVSVYPNPANDFLTIELQQEIAGQAVLIKVVDASGVVVHEVTTSGTSTRIGTGELAEGIYMYQAYAAGKLIASDKVIIRH